MLRLTTDHPSSSYGIPVFVDGDVLNYDEGIRRLLAHIRRREKLDTIVESRQWLADQIGFSARTVEGWEQGRMPDVRALLTMQQIL